MKFKVEIPEKFVTKVLKIVPNLWDNPANAVNYLVTEQLIQLLGYTPMDLDRVAVMQIDATKEKETFDVTALDISDRAERLKEKALRVKIKVEEALKDMPTVEELRLEDEALYKRQMDRLRFILKDSSYMLHYLETGKTPY